MRTLLRLSRTIDRFHDRLGRLVSWLTVAMVLLGAYNAVVRYLGRHVGWALSSNAYIEAQWYMFSVVFLLGASYTLRHDRHVRVDVLYGRLETRARHWVDLLGTLLLLIPFSITMLWLSWPAVRNSWSVLEGSPDPGGLARYPIKSVILVAFVLLLLQACSELIKHVGYLRGIDVDTDIEAAGHAPRGGP